MYELDKYTVSLLHFDDGIKDETGKVWTTNGGASVSSVQKKSGNSSLYLDGVDDYLSMATINDFLFTNDFTIESEVLIPSATIINDENPFKIFQIGDHCGGKQFFELSVTDHVINILLYNTNGYIVELYAPINLVRGEFNHIAAIRKGSQWYASYNRKIVGTANYDGTFFPNDSVKVGASSYLGNMIYREGYMDEFRISNIARWITPQLTAEGSDKSISLSWTAADGATSYIVKRSTISGGEYEIIASGVTDTNYMDTSVTNGTTYYYIVVAVSDDGESNNSNEASAIPVAADSTALLRVTMLDSSERDYQLSTSEIDSFINWYMKHTSTDTTGYMLTKKVGTEVSKEYLTLDKIISFEVIER